MALFQWLNIKNILAYHTPNGGYRNAIEGAKLKRLGVSPGVPDVCIPVPNSNYHGLYIEMKKRNGGIVSDNQKTWIERLNRNGYKAVVCRGFEEAQDLIINYWDKVSR